MRSLRSNEHSPSPRSSSGVETHGKRYSAVVVLTRCMTNITTACSYCPSTTAPLGSRVRQLRCCGAQDSLLLLLPLPLRLRPVLAQELLFDMSDVQSSEEQILLQQSLPGKPVSPASCLASARDLKGRVVVVTGAGSGFGAAYARLAASHG